MGKGIFRGKRVHIPFVSLLKAGSFFFFFFKLPAFIFTP